VTLRLVLRTRLFGTMVELVAPGRVAPRPAAQHYPADFIQFVPPLNAAGLSQRDNRYH